MVALYGRAGTLHSAGTVQCRTRFLQVQLMEKRS